LWSKDGSKGLSNKVLLIIDWNVQTFLKERMLLPQPPDLPAVI